jgi:hypothetical protein
MKLPTDEDEGVYWSSSMCSNLTAWSVDFARGGMTCDDMNVHMGIKAIKSF